MNADKSTQNLHNDIRRVFIPRTLPCHENHAGTWRGKFIVELKKQLPADITPALLTSLCKQPWVVFAKQPFANTRSLVEYLGRYIHKIAISNYRLKKHENGKVDFTYKDYKHGSVTKTMQLDDIEFIRRFSLHILPRCFVRIRHYGILSSSSKSKCAELIKAQLPPRKIPACIKLKPKRPPFYPKQCACCKQATMKTLLHFQNTQPSWYWEQLAKDLLEMEQPA